MGARDDLENRRFKSTIPDDLNDPPRYSQVIETTKDAFVIEMRNYFNEAQSSGRIQELPTIEKYAIDFGAGLDPYETTVRIVQEFSDVDEALPHIAIVATSGEARRLSVGVPFVAHIQLPPRVTTRNAEPYALADGDQLVLRTTPWTNEKDEFSAEPRQFEAATSVIRFDANRFPTANPITAARAIDVARLFTQRALYAESLALAITGGTGVQFQTGGPFGGGKPRNEIEVLSTSTPNLVTALGLGDFGTAGGADSITGTAPNMTLNIAAAPFDASMVSDGRYVTIDGAPTAANDGRFPITGVPAAGQLQYTNEEGVAETWGPPADPPTWFVGLRDTTANPARPVMNRYHISMDLTVGVEVITESTTTRRELLDLVQSFFSFWMEERYFTLLGRNVLEEVVYDGDGNPITDEHYQISVHSEVRSAGDAEVPRPPGDAKDNVFSSRIDVPVTTLMFIDRPATVLTGPSAGRSWTLESENVTVDEGMPFRS